MSAIDNFYQMILYIVRLYKSIFCVKSCRYEKFQPFFRQNFTFSTLYNFILLMLLILHIYPHTFRAGVIVSPFLSSFNLCKFSYLFLKHFCCAAVSMYPARIPVYPVLYLLYLFLCLSVKICSFRHFPAYHLICYLICSALP